MLDSVEDCLAALLAHRVAEDAAEQPDIVAQRQVFVFRPDCIRFRHGAPLCTAIMDGACPSLQKLCLTEAVIALKTSVGDSSKPE